MVIPVLEAKIDVVPGKEVPVNSYGVPVWQGAYIFTISPDSLEYKGKITHQKSGDDVLLTEFWINRSLYIKGEFGNVLYTVSNSKVQMNLMEDLSLINEVSFP